MGERRWTPPAKGAGPGRQGGRRAAGLLLWLALGALLLAAELGLCSWAQGVALRRPAVDLAYGAPLTAAQAEAAWDYAASQSNEAGIEVSFWRQDTVTASAGLRSAEAVEAVGFAGSAAACLGRRCLAGALPGSGDGYGCAVTRSLALELFGSTDALGQTVTVKGRAYGVTGIVAGEDRLLLCPASDGFTHAALVGVPADSPQQAVRLFAAASGLGAPQAVLYGPQRAALAGVLCWAPAALAGLALLAALLRRTLRWPALWREAAWLGLAAAAALLLPRALAALPGWLLPDRWSNFAFWRELAGMLRQL